MSLKQKRPLITYENYLSLTNKVGFLDTRIERLEKDQNYFFKDCILLEDHIFDALALINELISRAKTQIDLIELYCDLTIK